jgi:hypothetical protein
VQLLKVYANCLPTAHYNFLRAFCEHLGTVEAGNNYMTFGSFALVLGGNFFKPTSSATDLGAFQALAHQLFQHWRYIFANGPFENHDTYLIACRDIQLEKATIPRGQRLRALRPIDGDQWTVEVIGQPMTVHATDVVQTSDDDDRPTFWIHVGGGRDSDPEVGCLEPSNINDSDAQTLRTDVETDLEQLADITRQIDAATSAPDDTEKIRNLIAMSRLLAKF